MNNEDEHDEPTSDNGGDDEKMVMIDDDDSKENASSSLSSSPRQRHLQVTTMRKRQRQTDMTESKKSCDETNGPLVTISPSSTTTTTTTTKTDGSSATIMRNQQRVNRSCTVIDNNNSNNRNNDNRTDGNHVRKNNTKKRKDQDWEDMEWICAECKEAECGLVSLTDNDGNDNDDDDDIASKFLLCDGPCRRIFHLPCAGLTKLPGNNNDDDDDDEWFCKDCIKREHACAYCSEYGQDYVNVFPCNNHCGCGLFFHEACLQTHHVDYTYKKQQQQSMNNDNTKSTREDDSPLVDHNDDNEYDDDDEYGDDDDDDRPQIPYFTCPAHNCWTCTQKDMIQLEKDEADQERQQHGQDNKTTASKTTKKKRPKKRDSIFKCKTESRLFRCLYCPIAYHSTCIPPTARFHELAVLCHEHALSHKLPRLDLTSSIQSQLEEKVDKTLMRLHGVKKKNPSSRRTGGGLWDQQRKTSTNPFIPGLWGDKLDSSEQRLLQCIIVPDQRNNDEQKDDRYATRLNDDEADITNQQDHDGRNGSVTLTTASWSGSLSMAMDGSVPFCLPVDIKTEVYSKPPSYVHIQSLKYSSNKDGRPNKKMKTGANNKKLKDHDERCKCSGPRCGDDCFNRAVMTECTPTTCNLGGTDCGNRGLTKRQFVKCQPQRERGKGWGLVTLEAVPRGRLVLEYVGEVIDEQEKTERLQSWSKEHPNDSNFYVMGLSGGYYVDARDYANQSRFINHSCAPNCKVVSVNVKGQVRNGIYSIRDIKAGEFLSYDYHFDTKHGDRFVCRCGAPNCRGTMKGAGKNSDNKDQDKKATNWKEAKARYDADRQFLNDLHGRDVVSLVDCMLPEAEHPNELIAAGPLEKHRLEAIRGRIFLWRNVKLGSDFVSRNSRLETTAALMTMKVADSGSHRQSEGNEERTDNSP